MSDQPGSISNSDFVNIYLIKVKGCLDSEWSHWFEGLTITQGEDGTTLLAGRVVDDSALHGLLKKIRDLGMPLLSANVLDTDHSSQPGGIAGNKRKGKYLAFKIITNHKERRRKCPTKKFPPTSFFPSSTYCSFS